VNFLHAVYQQ